MKLWIQWLQAGRCLRPACNRSLTFVWMTLVLIGLCCRSDNLGVTSFVRVLNLTGDGVAHSRGAGVRQPGFKNAVGQARDAPVFDNERLEQNGPAGGRCLLRQCQGDPASFEAGASSGHACQVQCGGVRQASKPVSSSEVQRLICVEEMLISAPTSFCKTVMTLRVETPCTYISASAKFTACSERLPRSNALG